MKVLASLVSTVVTQKIATNIKEMMSAINPALEQQAYENYGCVARGFFDPVSKNLGDPVDHVDKAFNKWKNCRRCAKTHFEESELSLKEYRFNVEDQTCLDGDNSVERSVCMCDFEFAVRLDFVQFDPALADYDERKCSFLKNRSRSMIIPGCCAKASGSFQWYNADVMCCDRSGGLKAIGECL